MSNDAQTANAIRHIEALAATAADEVLVPPFERPEGSTRRQRRWGMSAAAAVVVVAAVGVGWWFIGDDEVRTVDSTLPAPVVRGERLVPTEWPTGLSGVVTARDSRSPLGVVQRHDVLSRGAATATVTAYDFPLGQPDASYDEYQLDGRTALWSDRDPGGSALSVAVSPGRTVSIVSRTSTRNELEELASAVAAADGELSAEALPDGWALAPDPARIADLLMNGHVREEWSTVSRQELDSNRGLSVSTRTVDDADAVRDLAEQISGHDGSTIDVDGDNDGLLVQLPPIDPAGTHEALIWTPAPHTVAVAMATDINRSEFIAAVRSSRTVAPTEWDALKQTQDAEQTRLVDGFDIPEDTVVIDTGEDFGVHWLLSEEQLDQNGHQTTFASLLIRDEQGLHGGGGGSIGAGSVGVIYGRVGPYVVLQTEVPSAATDVTIEVLDEHHRTARVPLPDGRTHFVFTVLPGPDTPDVSGTAVVHATLPDGTQLASPPDTIPD